MSESCRNRYQLIMQLHISWSMNGIQLSWSQGMLLWFTISRRHASSIILSLVHRNLVTQGPRE